MHYARLENGQLRVGLPTTGTLKDGRTVSGYNLLSDTALRVEGWKPLLSEMPEYNPDIQYLQFSGYEDMADHFLSKYTVVNIQASVPQEQEPSLEDYLIDLDYRLSLIELGV